MRSCNIFSCVMSCGSSSSEDGYSWKCPPSLCSIMDEGPLYGCHNPVLSTAHSLTVPPRGASQSIIDHPFFLHLLHSAKDERTKSKTRMSLVGQGTAKLLARSCFFGCCSSVSFSSSSFDWRDRMFGSLRRSFRCFGIRRVAEICWIS